jgi:hypothetical protein
MITDKRNRRFKPIGLAAVAALSLGTLTVLFTPAKAQIYFDVGPVGVGIGPPPGYYYPPYPYYRPYYRHYAPYYYGW